MVKKFFTVLGVVYGLMITLISLFVWYESGIPLLHVAMIVTTILSIPAGITVLAFGLSELVCRADERKAEASEDRH